MIKNFTSIIYGIVIIDVLISLSLGLLYYGKDAMEVGLGIYSAIYIPFIYLSYTRFTKNMRWGTITPLVYMLVYYFSMVYFPSIILALIVWAFLILSYMVKNDKNMSKVFIVSLIFIVIGGYLSTPYIVYNIDVSLYPLKYETWAGVQWNQRKAGQHCLEGDVFISTYEPSRLRILDTCVTVEGVVVTDINRAEDGDIYFDVKLDPQYEHMLSTGSWILRSGNIHVEIVPDDQDKVVIPEKGDRVRIVGVWVVDTDHGSWSEIHPTWYIEILE